MDSRIKKGPPVKEAPRVLTTSRGHGMLKARTVSGCEFNHPARKWQDRTNSVLITIPYVRPQGGLAVAVIRAHPGQNCIPTGPSESRVEVTPRKWTRWGWTAGQDDEPLRTEVWDGLPMNCQLSMRVSQRLSLDGVLPNE